MLPNVAFLPLAAAARSNWNVRFIRLPKAATVVADWRAG